MVALNSHHISRLVRDSALFAAEGRVPDDALILPLRANPPDGIFGNDRWR